MILPAFHSKFLDSASLVVRAMWPIYNALSSGTLTISAIPTVTFRLAVTLSASTTHTDCIGTVTVAGEVLTFLGSGKKTTTTNLITTPTITTSNIDCWILITAIDANGADLIKETVTPIACLYDDTVKGYYAANGAWTINNSRIQSDEVSTAVIGDVIRYNSKDNIIKFIHIQKHRLRWLEEFRTLQF